MDKDVMTQDADPNSATPNPAASPEDGAAPEAMAAQAEPAAAMPKEDQPDAAERIAALEAEVSTLKNDVLYARADVENTRRRLEQQAEDRAKYAVGNFAKEMVTVADNLRRAIDSLPANAGEENENVASMIVGIEMTERQLQAGLEKFGIKPVEAMGARFDPHLHQAMMEVDDASKPQGTVVMVMQTGYTIHDRLLRPAMVGVSKGGPKPGTQPPPAPDAPEDPPERGDSPGRVDTTA